MQIEVTVPNSRVVEVSRDSGEVYSVAGKVGVVTLTLSDIIGLEEAFENIDATTIHNGDGEVSVDGDGDVAYTAVSIHSFLIGDSEVVSIDEDGINVGAGRISAIDDYAIRIGTEIPGYSTGNITIGPDNVSMISGAISFTSSGFQNQVKINQHINQPIGWGDGYSNNSDVAFSRIEAGVVGLGTGASGNTGGSLELTDLTASGDISAVSITTETANIGSWNGVVSTNGFVSPTNGRHLTPDVNYVSITIAGIGGGYAQFHGAGEGIQKVTFGNEMGGGFEFVGASNTLSVEGSVILPNGFYTSTGAPNSTHGFFGTGGGVIMSAQGGSNYLSVTHLGVITNGNSNFAAGTLKASAIAADPTINNSLTFSNTANSVYLGDSAYGLCPFGTTTTLGSTAQGSGFEWAGLFLREAALVRFNGDTTYSRSAAGVHQFGTTSANALGTIKATTVHATEFSDSVNYYTQLGAYGGGAKISRNIAVGTAGALGSNGGAVVLRAQDDYAWSASGDPAATVDLRLMRESSGILGIFTNSTSTYGALKAGAVTSTNVTVTHPTLTSRQIGFSVGDAGVGEITVGSNVNGLWINSVDSGNLAGFGVNGYSYTTLPLVIGGNWGGDVILTRESEGVLALLDGDEEYGALKVGAFDAGEGSLIYAGGETVKIGSAITFNKVYANAQIANVSISNSGVLVNNAASFSFSSTSAWYDNPDVVLVRDAANTLALRNGANEQTLNLYGSYTDAENYYGGRIRVSSGDINIETFGAGSSGANRVAFSAHGAITFATSNTFRWMMNSSGHLIAGTDNSYDIGSSGANRPRNLHLGGYALANTGYYFGLAGTAVGFEGTPASGVIRLYADVGFNYLQFGGTSSSFPALKRSGTELQVRLADDSGDASLKASLGTFYNVLITDGSNGALFTRASINQSGATPLNFSIGGGFASIDFNQSITVNGNLTLAGADDSGYTISIPSGTVLGTGDGGAATGGNIYRIYGRHSASSYLESTTYGWYFAGGVYSGGNVRFGTTDSTSMIKSNGTELQIRLADDSGYTLLRASGYKLPDTAFGTPSLATNGNSVEWTNGSGASLTLGGTGLPGAYASGSFGSAGNGFVVGRAQSGLYGFSANWFTGSFDTSISSPSAGVIQIGDGGVNANGSLIAATGTFGNGRVVLSNFNGGAYGSITSDARLYLFSSQTQYFTWYGDGDAHGFSVDVPTVAGYGYLKASAVSATACALTATGAGSNIDINIVPKGTGKITASGSLSIIDGNYVDLGVSSFSIQSAATATTGIILNGSSILMVTASSRFIGFDHQGPGSAERIFTRNGILYLPGDTYVPNFLSAGSLAVTGATTLHDDLELDDPDKGVILTDRTLETRHRVFLDNGVISLEAA